MENHGFRSVKHKEFYLGKIQNDGEKNRVIFKASPEGLKIFRRISQIFEGNRQVKNDFDFYLPNLNLNRGIPRF